MRDLLQLLHPYIIFFTLRHSINRRLWKTIRDRKTSPMLSTSQRDCALHRLSFLGVMIPMTALAEDSIQTSPTQTYPEKRLSVVAPDIAKDLPRLQKCKGCYLSLQWYDLGSCYHETRKINQIVRESIAMFMTKHRAQAV